jgi:hypothetical protein
MVMLAVLGWHPDEGLKKVVAPATAAAASVR